MLDNVILQTDSYKASHWKQYPPGTQIVSSYIESRAGDPSDRHQDTVFFGLQMFLYQNLSKPITQQNVEEAEEFFAAHGEPFNKDGWMDIINRHGGWLPIEIQAVPEGLVVPRGNVLVQLNNTDPTMPWLTSYMETALLRAVWYPTTVATVSRNIKKIIKLYLRQTSDNPDQEIGFKLHDFGARGASSSQTAMIGGAAHLVNFLGSDTVEGVWAANKYYDAGMAGFSIPASEHSTMTTWGQECELAAFENMVDQFAVPGGLVAVVSDSYNIYHAVNNLWPQLSEKVKQTGSTIVVRPDSGHPINTPVDVVEALANAVGTTVNSKGYKVLPNHFRVIQGDGVNADSIAQILQVLKAKGFSASNIAFGMGAELLQKVNRDTLRFAMKASAAKVSEQWRNVYKDPITDPGKTSKKGILALVETCGIGNCRYQTVLQAAGQKNVLQPVYKNGRILRTQNLDQIRQLAKV